MQLQYSCGWIVQGMGAATRDSCPGAAGMGLLWERESCRIFLDRIADEACRADFLTMLQSAVANAGLKAQGGWTTVFTELDLERLPRHQTFSLVGALALSPGPMLAC